MVVIDRLDAGQSDGGALDPARITLKLMRLDIADHDAVIGSQEVAVDMHRCAARGLAQARQVRLVAGVVADDAIAIQQLGWQNGAVLGRRHSRMRTGRDDEKHIFVAYPGVAHALQDGWQQMLVRHWARLVVDGDGDRLPGARRSYVTERIVYRVADDSGGVVSRFLRPRLHKLHFATRRQIRP